MLSADFEEPPEDQEASLETWQAMLQTYAGLQKSLGGQEDWLFEVGCMDRRLDVLTIQFSALLESPVMEKTLEPDEAAQLKNLKAALLESCDRLGALGIPYTLSHGDLHAGNILIQENRFVFFDWTDACVAHPFFDLPYLLIRLPESLEAPRDTLTQTYLACWSEYGSLETLEASQPLVRLLSYLHQTLTCWRINEGLEMLVRHELGSMLLYFLGKILEEVKGR